MNDKTQRGLFNLEKTSVLIADGDLMGMSILTQILSGFGAVHMVRASRAVEARQHLLTTPFDLIVLDPATLGEEGYALPGWVRRSLHPPARFTPIVIVTGHTQTGRVSAARDGGAHFVISKPVSPRVVFDRISWIARDKRPFVSCTAYAGPDRRWKDDGPPDDMGRRDGDQALNVPTSAPDCEPMQSTLNSTMQSGRAVT